MSWAREPLSRMTAENLSYQELFSLLEASLQQEQEEKAALLRDNTDIIQQKSIEPSANKIPGIFWNGQPRYANNNNWRKQSRNTSSTSKSCWNCGSTKHLIRKCPKLHDVAEIAARKVQYYDKKKFNNENKALKQVLFEVCEQLCISDSKPGNYDDANVFFGGCIENSSDEESSDCDTDSPTKQAEELLTQVDPDISSSAEPSLANCFQDF